MPRHSAPCTCGARHWRVSEHPAGGYWLETCQQCGATRQQPTRPEQGHPLRKYKDPTAHAPTVHSQIWVAGSRDTRKVY